MLKSGIITQVRMTSTRLPGKVLKNIKGRPLLQYHVDRLEKSGLPIFLATTYNKTDDCIEEFACQNNLSFYRGDENHVLSRYYECAKNNELDLIVRVTSDCPLIDGNLVRSAVDQYINIGDQRLYLSNCIQRTFPRGFDIEVFSFSLLEEAYIKATEIMDLEHVTPYIHQNRSGSVRFRHMLHSPDKSDIRVTVDTSEDFILINRLIDMYHADQMGYKEIIDLFDYYPELRLINNHVEQKKS